MACEKYDIPRDGRFGSRSAGPSLGWDDSHCLCLGSMDQTLPEQRIPDFISPVLLFSAVRHSRE